MENATKALMMAGGVILVMLLVSLFIYAWGTFSEYYASQQELSEISGTTEFNQQFTNYDRDDVSGYELISLANRIADYNQRYSTTGTNDENYVPVTLTINFNTTSGLSYDGTMRLFTSTSYTQSDTSNQIQNILNTVISFENAVRRFKLCF